MNVQDLITADDYEFAPSDQTEAFTFLVMLAQRRLEERLSNVHPQDEFEYEQINEARFSFVNVVVGLAKVHNIEQIANLYLPKASDFDARAYRQFKADLDHYLIQIVAGNAMRVRQDSFALKDDVKRRIRAHLHHIREQIHAAGLSDARRDALIKRIEEFEKALEKDRINTMAIARFVFEVLSVSANVIALSESQTFHRLLMNVMQAGAEAKAQDDENRRLPPQAPPLALSPPRTEPPKRKGSFSTDLDDEIPF